MTAYFPSLTAVVHQMVREAEAPKKAIADNIGYRRYQTFISEISGQPGHKLGADMLLPLMAQCESDAIVEFLARERGGVFIRLPEPAQNSGDLAEALSLSIKEFGDFVSVSAQSVTTGVVGRLTHEGIAREGHEAMEAIMDMIHLARATHNTQHGVPMTGSAAVYQ